MEAIIQNIPTVISIILPLVLVLMVITNIITEVLKCQRRSDFVVFRRTGNVEKWRVNVYSP